MKRKYEKIRISPEHRSIIRTFISLIDPLNLPRLIINAMTSDRFFFDESFFEQRERLRHFFDMFVPIKFEEISDAIYLRLVKILNHLFNKSYELEIDVDGVKRLIIKLYPNRKIIQEHRLILDTLADM
ncbi:MAG: hypothetical protein ACTSRW_07600 [Candidatus Helarchaeota archaeon]